MLGCTAAATLFLLPVAHAEALLSLIEKGGKDTNSVNRTLPFVELRDTAGRDREYSVPYVPDQMAKNAAADFVANWKTYQDTLHWAMMVGLNNNLTALGTPHDLRFMNCTLQLPANLTIAAGQLLTGSTWVKADPGKVSLKVSNPGERAKKLPAGGVNGWRDDGVKLEAYDVPRVDRNKYCQYSSTAFMPDEFTQYVPGVRQCLPLIGCISSPNYPQPISVNWGSLAARLQEACAAANKGETTEYQKQNLASLTKNFPTAIHWNGAMTVTGVRSGTSMAPIYTPLGSNLTSVANITKTDPRFPVYLNGLLPMDPGTAFQKSKPGVPDLEVLKRYLEMGNLDEQESQGEAAFFQTWQQLDTLNDFRPLRYWAKALQCSLFACTPIPVLLPTPVAFVTPATCTVPAGGPRTGSTNINQFRYRWGVVSVPEGYAVPNVTGTPVLRVDKE
ncbi:hypothetical protein GCM10008019_32510 [Deinococcus soli (ex Cha et al. 2016)]|nr:hypothetical protein GCM10008019_32510 [Deinococcus soli (ex Cha et al. 2016)]